MENTFELKKYKRIKNIILDNPFDDIELKLILDMTSKIKVKIEKKELKK